MLCFARKRETCHSSTMQDSELVSTKISAPSKEVVILHVFPSFAIGGQQARLASLARGLGRGYRHFIVALDGEHGARALFSREIKASFSTLRMKKTSWISASNIWRLRKIIISTAPNLLCTYNWGSIEAIIANKTGPRTPHVHFEDGFGPDETLEKQSSKRVLVRRWLLRNTQVVAPSVGLEAAAKTKWKLRNVCRLENGVDFDRLQAGSRSHSTAVVVGSLGALRKEKNYGRLIAAFLAADRSKAARLEIVGGGPEHDELRQQARNDERISLPGATADAAQAYSRFDIFALSSDTEQAPISLMEAMASGLPVLATNVGDIADMVSEENLPYVTPLGDEEAYAFALAQLLQNPSARASIGAANRKKAKECFSLERMIDAHRALYDRVMRQ